LHLLFDAPAEKPGSFQGGRADLSGALVVEGASLFLDFFFA